MLIYFEFFSHGDITLNNIMYIENGRIFLIDFGLAVFKSDDYSKDFIIGTKYTNSIEKSYLMESAFRFQSYLNKYL